jgi:hypothetical protein
MFLPDRHPLVLPRCCARGRAQSGCRGKRPYLAMKTTAAKIILGWMTGNDTCQKRILPDNKNLSAQEDWADVLPSREVEQEKLDILDGK